MVKFEFINEEKSIIRHNLVPELLIEVIRLQGLENYRSINGNPDTIFFEFQIKKFTFVLLLKDYVPYGNEESFHIASIVKRAAKWYKAKILSNEIDF